MDDASGIIHWDIPFSPGKLTAEGIGNDGNVESKYDITTSGRPFAIQASSDKTSFTKPGEVAHVTIEIVDENGVPVKLADNEIRVNVKGGELLGLEAGDNSDMGNYRDNRQRVFRGRLLAYVRTDNPAEPMTITLTSPLLRPATLTIK